MAYKIQDDPDFDVLVNDRGEVLIAIYFQETKPENPVVTIEGGKITFIHGEENVMNFTKIPADILLRMKVIDEVLIVESEGDAIKREYMVPISTI